jgi:hypothetical protein
MRQEIAVQRPQVKDSVSEVYKSSLMVGTSRGLWVLDAQPQLELEGHSIDAIALNSNGLWAIVNRNSVWHRRLDGEWRKITSIEHLKLNCILPIENTVLVGTSEAHLMQIMRGDIRRIESFDWAEGREKWYTPWGGLPDVRSLAVGSSGEWYVNIHVGGILRSLDRGHSWQPTLDLHADVHEVRTVSDRADLVLAATARGLAISKNGGDSWEFDRTHLHATYARAVAVSGDRILMSVSSGPGGSRAAIYRRQLEQAGTFAKCDRGLPEWFSDNINTGCLAASGDVAAFGTSDGQIFGSQDAGLTWEQIGVGLGSIHCLHFAPSSR